MKIFAPLRDILFGCGRQAALGNCQVGKEVEAVLEQFLI